MAAGTSGALGVALTGCGAGHRATSPPLTTASPPVTTTSPSVTTTSPSGTRAPATGAQSSFASVINDAMKSMQPLPGGMEAPDALPPAPRAISAEATGLGGTYSVTLIATASPEPVNSPDVASAAAKLSSDLGSFSTTPASSSADALAHVGSLEQRDLSSCASAATPLELPGGAPATSCTTVQGPAVNWRDGPWRAQVQGVGGSEAPTAMAKGIASWLADHRLPQSDLGILSVSVPLSPQAGPSTNAELQWAHGPDVYQVTTLSDATAALAMASSMRPWPGNGR